MFQQARDTHIYMTYNKQVNCECDFSLACKLEAKNGIVMYVTIIDVNFSFLLKRCIWRDVFALGQFHWSYMSTTFSLWLVVYLHLTLGQSQWNIYCEGSKSVEKFSKKMMVKLSWMKMNKGK
jgi:hypothetical protein